MAIYANPPMPMPDIAEDVLASMAKRQKDIMMGKGVRIVRATTPSLSHFTLLQVHKCFAAAHKYPAKRPLPTAKREKGLSIK